MNRLSRPALALVLLSIAATGHAATDPLAIPEKDVHRFQDLAGEAMQKYKAKDWEGAIAAFAAQSAIYDRNDDSLYNWACVYALARKKPEALDTLAKAVECGFVEADHMRGDSDLDAIRLDARFDGILARAEELAKAPAADPFATEAAPAASFPSLGDLEAHFAARRSSLERVAPILGKVDGRELATRLARDEVAALAAYRRSHPDEAEEALYRTVKAMAGAERPSAALAKAADELLKAHPASPHAAEVMFLKAEAEASAIEPVDEESWNRRTAILGEASRKIVERYPDAEGLRDAYFWAYRGARERGDGAEARRLYGIMKQRWGSDEAFWSQNAYDFFEETLMDGVPAFDVTGIGGERMSLETARGKVTLLDFWATWCRPCIAEIPHLKEAYEKYHAKGFEIFGISGDRPEDTSVADFKAWVAEKGMAWPQYYDDKSEENALVTLFGIQGFPTTILLDREGKVVGVNVRGKELVTKVGELVAAGPASGS